MTWYIEGNTAEGNLDVFATDKVLGNYRVCMVDCDDNTVSEQDLEANTRLIAAAPELLTALEEIRNLATWHSAKSTTGEIYACANAAIAKATGQ